MVSLQPEDIHSIRIGASDGRSPVRNWKRVEKACALSLSFSGRRHLALGCLLI